MHLAFSSIELRWMGKRLWVKKIDAPTVPLVQYGWKSLSTRLTVCLFSIPFYQCFFCCITFSASERIENEIQKSPCFYLVVKACVHSHLVFLFSPRASLLNASYNVFHSLLSSTHTATHSMFVRLLTVVYDYFAWWTKELDIDTKPFDYTLYCSSLSLLLFFLLLLRLLPSLPLSLISFTHCVLLFTSRPLTRFLIVYHILAPLSHLSRFTDI